MRFRLSLVKRPRGVQVQTVEVEVTLPAGHLPTLWS